MTRRNLLRLLFAVPGAQLLGAGVPGFGAVTPFENPRGILLHAVKIVVAGGSALISIVVDGKLLSSFVHSSNYGEDLIVEHHLAMPPIRIGAAVQFHIETLTERPFTLFHASVRVTPEPNAIPEWNGLVGLWQRRRKENLLIDLERPSPGFERWMA